MPKRIREGVNLRIAPGIMGTKKGGIPVIFSEDCKKKYAYNNIDDKIEIYEKQVNGWFLKHSSNLAIQDGGSFVSVMIALSYIEGVQQYKEGCSSNSRSGGFFIEGFKDIFGNGYSDDDIRALYKEARCGLFHDGMTRGDIILKSDSTTAITFDREQIIISPRLFIREIEKHFNDYIAILKDVNNEDQRDKFNSMYRLI